MNKCFVKICLFFAFSCLGPALFAQVNNIYISKQTGQSSNFNGSYAKQTDNFEQGTVSLSTSGPLVYGVTPNDLSIQPNQNKSWDGNVTGNVASAPDPGNSVNAQLIANYDIQYSRPYGVGTNGSVQSTYYCSDNGSASGNGGCAFHGTTPGAHEIVRDAGQKAVDFTVYSINITLPDTVCLGKTGEKAVTPISFPAQGGNFVWSSTNSNVQITNATEQTATIKLLDTTIKNATVKVEFTIEGISYETSAVLSTCDCSCKPIKNGIDAGPVHLTFNVDPSPVNPDADGNCMYHAEDAAFSMTLDGGLISRIVNVQNGVKVSFGKNCQTSDLTVVKIDWQGEIAIPELEIKGIKTFALTVKEIHLSVATDGALGGTVTINVLNPEDRDLSLGKKFVMLRKGTNSDITFGFNNTNGWAGTFDFSGIQGIVIDLCKQSEGEEVILANFTGDITSDGTLSGDLTAMVSPSYQTNFFKVTLLELQLGVELKIPDASFRLTSGTGKVQLSEMKAVTGTIDLGLELPEAGGCVASFAAADLKAFSMTLDEFTLQADFNRDFDLTKVEGSLKAKHDKFDVKVGVDKFKVENGSLTEFTFSGKVKYSGFSFTLEQASYVPVKLNITAKVEMSATGTEAMLAVKDFTIDDAGTIAITSISGNLNRPPASISFSATFGTSRFTGTFSGDFAAIGLDGTVDIGAEGGDDPYNFAYLAITAKVNVPLGQSGLKLTQIGGKVGYNYQLQGVEGPGDPMKGNYMVALKLGVADIGNMCEVTGQSMIQFGNGNIDITLSGTIAVLKNNKFFEGAADVTYKIPAQTLSGSIQAVIWIPGSGSVFKSQNLKINFFFGNNAFSANGANMGGSMFGDKIQLTNGNFSLSGQLDNVSSLSGSLGGKASCSFAYSVSVSGGGNSVTGTITLNMNSNVNVSFNQNGLNGNFDVVVNGGGKVDFDTWIWTDQVQATATCNGTVGYNGGSVSMSGDITITLPFSIPFWGNEISTGVVSVSI